ncbi:mitochondrial amino-acid acetyltransferase [Mycena leptocephala]|nr:mitochondrial amino-acid acetyltransferase [Mycena leptocephala]
MLFGSHLFVHSVDDRVAQTIRSLRHAAPEPDDVPPSDNDFIVSILRANPSLRDTRSYLASFGPRPKPASAPSADRVLPVSKDLSMAQSIPVALEHPKPSPVLSSILDPVLKRTALVKLQGPFTDVQLDSIARGMVYLEKLGLVSVIVVENDTLARGEQDERSSLVEETMRIVTTLEKQGARARPVLGAVVRLGPKPGDEDISETPDFRHPEAHTFPSDLVPIRSALRAGEIPVIPPFALDSFCRSVRVDANDVLGALARGMVEAAGIDNSQPVASADILPSEDVDLTPLRLMIINREGGVPSYARSGYPHLLINLTSEHAHIHETFHEPWHSTNPTALSNLALARTCLTYMPPTSSAVMVSHRSPSSLIANLITNKPALSSSLPHALLQGNRRLTAHTPTLLRRDERAPRAIIRKNTRPQAFYDRLERTLDFVIVAGDYVGAAIVTNEPSSGSTAPISYLDKFAVLPSHQGDGTVDFLWVALHDESYGLGHPFSANPNGGKGGVGEGRDLVWRSRANNPVNKWYFERSSGHMRMGPWVLFWCDAEKRLKLEQASRANTGMSYVEKWEKGRLGQWAGVWRRSLELE